jgi:hypothetical protein
MTDSQFLVLLGTVYLAPQLHPIVGNFTGMLLILAAAGKGLGWI